MGRFDCQFVNTVRGRTGTFRQLLTLSKWWITGTYANKTSAENHGLTLTTTDLKRVAARQWNTDGLPVVCVTWPAIGTCSAVSGRSRSLLVMSVLQIASCQLTPMENRWFRGTADATANITELKISSVYLISWRQAHLIFGRVEFLIMEVIAVRLLICEQMCSFLAETFHYNQIQEEKSANWSCTPFVAGPNCVTANNYISNQIFKKWHCRMSSVERVAGKLQKENEQFSKGLSDYLLTLKTIRLSFLKVWMWIEYVLWLSKSMSYAKYYVITAKC